MTFDNAYAKMNTPELNQLRESVVFIFADGADPCLKTSLVKPIGTGFLVSLQSKSDPEKGFKFVVTNRHVLRNQDRVYIRLNNASQTEFVCGLVNVASNVFYPTDNSIDLAAIAITEIPGSKPVAFDTSYVLSVAAMRKAEVEEGTDIVSIGYLQPYAGLQKNMPVMHFGKISLLTDEKWFSEDGKNFQQGYIVEIYNVGGSSGSPIVLQPSQVRVNKEGVLQNRRMPPLLLGVIKGYPNSLASIAIVENKQITKLDTERVALVSSGVAVVEPADNLRKFLVEIAEELNKSGQSVSFHEPFSEIETAR